MGTATCPLAATLPRQFKKDDFVMRTLRNALVAADELVLKSASIAEVKF